MMQKDAHFCFCKDPNDITEYKHHPMFVAHYFFDVLFSNADNAISLILVLF